jgi:hypothetical protein
MTPNTSKRSRKALLDMELSTFEVPPSGEALVLAKRCPIGPEAAKRMLDTVAPGQFELIQPGDDVIDGILVKKYLLLRTDKESLIKTILEEAKAIMGDQCMIRVRCDIRVAVRREIQG